MSVEADILCIIKEHNEINFLNEKHNGTYTKPMAGRYTYKSGKL